ncbi:DUF3592 domain-containing protein [Halorubrum halodurans]|uniref:DUF3592 domain-containing protein n=1 Tax=Halorubrum halodurans TaxID=1383851 RepID=A0A256IRF4_9EURY|nr:DUF3592 domain-containing protein [Halorubrum halodurans]OYR59124.1 hypothetical protein DJ70_01350 [Halorubrum halodurans]
MSPDTDVTVAGREIDPVRGGLLFLVVGLAIAGYGGYDYLQQQQAIETAEPVEAAVLETDLDSTSSASSPDVDYYPFVRYEYAYRGERYTATGVYPASVRRSYDTRSAAADVIDEYETGETVTAYVTPDAPGDAFLRKQRSNAPFLAIGIGAVIALTGGRSALRDRA